MSTQHRGGTGSDPSAASGESRVGAGSGARSMLALQPWAARSWCVRPAGLADLPGLHQWLPAGAARDLPQHDGELWLVLQRSAAPAGGEAAAGGEVVAALRLRRAIGLGLPRYWFHVGCVVHAAAPLNLFQRRDTLLLGNDLTAATEWADLCCDPVSLDGAEQALAWQLLLRSAALVVASRRSSHATRLIAELPGRRDAQGASAFWQGLGRHFYAGDPAQAEARFGADWRSHLAPLLPRQPVYTAFLPEAARAVIAQAAEAARPLADALIETGLAYGHHVRIDDAGPVLEADVDRLLAALGARCSPVVELPAAAPQEPAALLPKRRHPRDAGRAGRWLLLEETAEGPVVTLRQGQILLGRAAAAASAAPSAGGAHWVLGLDS